MSLLGRPLGGGLMVYETKETFIEDAQIKEMPQHRIGDISPTFLIPPN